MARGTWSTTSALEASMKVEYDSDTDTLTVTLRRGGVAESDEHEPGLILDHDEAGDLLSSEVLDATGRISTPTSHAN
jgi:uncharacterized protein YuzE